ncbi:hypothetical protein NliqN6_3226 [Naganishia liquefaciens]|uniref:Uncharacterized protein n=1 Tax=Naganishia liquefaciens TaxID=104408 RepID=A0A8H3TVB6_9TREE|nr:hypothetical protein NliqN6_3226 [Naganishia liquefaciens]
MGYRSPELHITALSPSEYAAYTPIVAKLLEQEHASKASDSISTKGCHRLLKEEFSANDKRLQTISANLPSYPSSHLSTGEVYATLRLLAHEQHSSSGETAQEELVFIQTRPLTRAIKPHVSNAQTASKKEPKTSAGEDKVILSGPLLPPPRRQASLNVSLLRRDSQDPSASRRTGEQSSAQKVVGRPSPTVPRRTGHGKSKSVDAQTALPSSTPLLNPFRTPQGDGMTGFVAPPPVPPKPSKMKNAAKAEATASLLVAIDDEDTRSKTDSNPFRRKSIQVTNDRVGEYPKPPLPPRQTHPLIEGGSAGQIELGNPIETQTLPPRPATISASPSKPVDRNVETVPRPPGSQARVVPPASHQVQPTSFLQPSRLIRDGLLAAQKAREGHTPPRVASPNNVVTLANYTTGGHSPARESRMSSGDSRSERSHLKYQQTSRADAVAPGRHRSSTFSSITTGGTTSTGSTTSTSQAVSSEAYPRDSSEGRHNASPFVDPQLIDTSLPLPLRRDVPPRRDGTAQGTPSFDIIATSADEDFENSRCMRGDLSRRSTLKSNSNAEHGLAAMQDLGEDVRRAAEGVGKDLAWIRGGRGGRTLGMTLTREEDGDGDARKGLIEIDIERDNTGSTTLSQDHSQKM